MIILTGVPGTGKTTVAKELKKLTNCEIINQKEIAKRIKAKKDNGEYVVDLKKFFGETQKIINEYWRKKRPLLLEGALFGERRLYGIKMVIVLKEKLEKIEKRLKERGYSQIKIDENVFCEMTNYFEKLYLLYPKKKIMIITPKQRENLTPLETARKILSELKKRGVML